MAQVWETDATNITDIGAFDQNLLVETPSIRKFLNTERDTRYFVIATKGLGKTLLLRYKRILYQTKHINKDMVLLPENSLVDKIQLSTNFSVEKIDLFNNVEVWKEVWELSIIISVLKSQIRNRNNQKNREVYNLFLKIKRLTIVNKLLDHDKNTSLDYLGDIIELRFKEFYKLRSELNTLRPLYREMSIQIAIFIDNIDEIFLKHLQTPSMNTSQVLGTNTLITNYSTSYREGILSYNIWYLSQIGLIKAVRGLSDINHHIKVFASIRKEAYVRFKQEDEMSLQFIGNVLDLQYTKNQLKEMFIKNIQQTDPLELSDPSSLDKDAIYSFLGINEITNNRTGIKEEIFPYICRHTLKRPRDIMAIGLYLSQLGKTKSEEDIRNTVNKTASDIADEYMKEVSPHIDFIRENFDDLFKLIPTKILKKEYLKKICSKFNSKSSCEIENCKNCGEIHVFCNLYKIGLLGIIKKNYNGQYYQHFEQPGEMTFCDDGIIPNSSFYFIHPLLTKFVLEYSTSKEYELDKRMIVGDGYPCDPDFMDTFYQGNTFTCNKCLMISSNKLGDFTTRLVDNLNTKFDVEGIPYKAEPWNKDNHKMGSLFLDKVNKAIHNNSIIIADISDLNPNVFFECGMAVALGKSVILIKNESTHLSNFNMTYTAYSDADEQKLVNELSAALKDNELVNTEPNIFSQINNINTDTTNKKDVWVLSFDLHENTIHEFKNEGYNIVPKDELKTTFFSLEVATKLVNAKAILVNLFGKQDTVNHYTLYDSKLMFLAGFCYAREIPIKVFQDNNNFYADVLELCVLKSTQLLINFVDNLSLFSITPSVNCSNK